jgi:hypothetical protein
MTDEICSVPSQPVPAQGAYLSEGVAILLADRGDEMLRGFGTLYRQPGSTCWWAQFFYVHDGVHHRESSQCGRRSKYRKIKISCSA